MSCTATTAAALRVSVIENARGLAELVDSWIALTGDVPFAGPTWLSTWWRHYGVDSHRLMTLVVRGESGEVVGLAPWYVEHRALAGRMVRFLGDGEVCSDYLTVLARPDCTHRVASAVADWLVQEARYEWDVLHLNGAVEGDAAMQSLIERLAQNDVAVRSWSSECCWRANLPPTWDEYLALLSKSRRQRCRQIQRRLIETGRLVRHDVRDASDLARGWDVLVDLHQKRRQTLGQSGCFVSQQFAAFHREVAELLLEQNALRLFWVEVDGRPAAVEYSLSGGTGVYYYQGGIDPALAEFSPGSLAFISSLSGAIAQGCQWFDFLRGDEPYKASWRATPRRLMTWRLTAPRAAAKVRSAAWQAGRTVKGWARRGRNSLLSRSASHNGSEE